MLYGLKVTTDLAEEDPIVDYKTVSTRAEPVLMHLQNSAALAIKEYVTHQTNFQIGEVFTIEFTLQDIDEMSE